MARTVVRVAHKKVPYNSVPQVCQPPKFVWFPRNHPETDGRYCYQRAVNWRLRANNHCSCPKGLAAMLGTERKPEDEGPGSHWKAEEIEQLCQNQGWESAQVGDCKRSRQRTSRYVSAEAKYPKALPQQKAWRHERQIQTAWHNDIKA